MPLYEYKCRACGHLFERIRKFSDPPLNECPECGGEVEKLISAPAIQFKGDGWYITDYARKKDGPSSTQTGKSDSSSSGDSSSSSSSSDSEKSGKSEKSEKSESTTKSDSSKDSASKPASASTKKND